MNEMTQNIDITSLNVDIQFLPSYCWLHFDSSWENVRGKLQKSVFDFQLFANNL